ncbi:MAG: hypothetical protein RR396_06175, partial [Clostridiales bacterium]
AAEKLIAEEKAVVAEKDIPKGESAVLADKPNDQLDEEFISVSLQEEPEIAAVFLPEESIREEILAQK